MEARMRETRELRVEEGEKDVVEVLLGESVPEL